MVTRHDLEENRIQYFDVKRFGERVKAQRKKLGMTQSYVSEKLGYSETRQLQRIEAGESACSIDKLVELAQILEVTTDFLLLEKNKGGSEIEKYIANLDNARKRKALKILQAAFETE